MDCSISAVYLYEIAVWCCHLSSLAYDSVQKRANFLMNLGCSLGAEAAALVGGDDSEVRSLAFSQISKCCLRSIFFLM